MTEKTYWHDSYRRAMTARLRQVRTAGAEVWVLLEQTIFYPGGGGQPADLGTLDGMPVLDLREEAGEVWHRLAAPPAGKRVKLELDFARRYDLMQQHTAQHLLSQVCLRRLGAATLSFALGVGHTTIEIDRAELAADERAEVERECLAEVAARRRVRAYQTDRPESIPFRRQPKVSGRVRVVEIVGLDHSACAGTHLANTAEIGWIKIVSTDRVRGHVRLSFVAGGRALADHQQRGEVTRHLEKMLTCGARELPEAVRRLLDERDGLARDERAMRGRWVAQTAREALADPAPLIVRELPGWEPGDMAGFVAAVTSAGRCVLAYDREAGHLLVGRGQGTLDLRGLAPRLFALVGGKGGGRAELIAGRAGDFSRLDELTALLCREFQRE